MIILIEDLFFIQIYFLFFVPNLHEYSPEDYTNDWGKEREEYHERLAAEEDGLSNDLVLFSLLDPLLHFIGSRDSSSSRTTSLSITEALRILYLSISVFFL